ncbi:DUF938 domain-containing protein [Dyella sp.]|jgi:cyclopropane fatty-acyl-phospholipid synthase-like methyltransferase|uniref:DUF938 domain-containing protein n=1 Tax=Dyella sp. TaxID=1869338 RepID=UPI002D780A5C|nr:DUF938 domain-containing protein [Dyella sp.]HET6431395.1 DUF938 domain-containing protein [Dyella sp.]
MLPDSPACVRNRGPILEVLQHGFADRQRVLEIGSGTGQHAVHFAAGLPRLVWQSSDREEHLPGIRAWLAHASLPNTPAPLALDVDGPWPAGRYDAVFSANTLHIMGWPQVQRLFAALPGVTTADARLVMYGPFNDAGRFTSESNAAFDAALKVRDPRMGIRDWQAVDALAMASGFALQARLPMPANNACLVWQRGATIADAGSYLPR